MYSEEESIGEADENDLEIIDQGHDVEDSEIVAEDNNEETTEQNTETENQEETGDKKVVKPKRVIKNPQPKLNEQTLQGPRGLSAIPGHFERVKFKGRGYEENDLNVLMKTYEYWCHRLVPKFAFHDCIARLETLGSKKVTQTQIKRIRMGINFDNDEPVLSEEEEDHTAGFVDATNDQFDQLLSTNREPVTAPTSQLSEEQLERIRQNKERAKRLREEKLRNIQEKAQSNLEPSSRLIHESNEASTANVKLNGTSAGTDDMSVSEKQQGTDFEHNAEIGSEVHGGNEEDDIDNILDFINADEPSCSKQKKLVLESDSEDEPTKETTVKVKKSVSKRIIDSDDDEVSYMEKNKETINSHNVIESNEDEHMDIDNILTDINADNGSVVANKSPQDVNRNKENESEPMLKEINTNNINNEKEKNNYMQDCNRKLGVVNDKYDLENNLNRANVVETESNSLNEIGRERIGSEMNRNIEKAIDQEKEIDVAKEKSNEINCGENADNYNSQRKEVCQDNAISSDLGANKTDTVVYGKKVTSEDELAVSQRAITDVSSTDVQPMELVE